MNEKFFALPEESGISEKKIDKSLKLRYSIQVPLREKIA